MTEKLQDAANIAMQGGTVAVIASRQRTAEAIADEIINHCDPAGITKRGGQHLNRYQLP